MTRRMTGLAPLQAIVILAAPSAVKLAKAGEVCLTCRNW